MAESENETQPQDNKNLLLFDKEVMRLLKEGVDDFVDAVRPTLGPAGRRVAIEKMVGNPQITKDGVSVAREIEFGDPRAAGGHAVKQASVATSETAGDGTTTALVLAQDLFNRSVKQVSAGVHPEYLRRGMNKALEHGTSFLHHELGFDIEDPEEIRQIAVIASDNDGALGELIAEAVETVGKDGIVQVEESKTGKTHLDYSEGLQIDRGYMSHDFLPGNEGELDLDEPLILAADESLTEVYDVLPAMEFALEQNRPLLVAAHDVEGEAYQTLASNVQNGKLEAVAIKAPRVSEKRTEILDNLGVLTGGQVTSKYTGVRPDSDDPASFLGTAESAKITKSWTRVIGGDGSDDAIRKRIISLRGRKEKSDSEHDKEFYQQQISQMSGGLAVLRIGASTETELKESKARAEDALSATQSAVDTGIVPGSGAAYLQIADYLAFLEETDRVEFEDPAERAGWTMMVDALESPFRQIVKNGGYNTEKYLMKYRDAVDSSDDPNLAFDMRDGTIGNAYELGIIDPVRVIDQVMRNATSVASTLVTSSCLIHKEGDDDEDDALN